MTRAHQSLPVINELRAAGIVALAPLAAELNKRQCLTPTGKSRWHPMTVKRVLDYAHRRVGPDLQLLLIINGLRAAGIVTLAALAAELNRRQCPTPSGHSHWYPQTVRRVLADDGRPTKPGRASHRAKIANDGVAAALLPVLDGIWTSGIISDRGVADELNRRGIAAFYRSGRRPAMRSTRISSKWYPAGIGYLTKRCEAVRRPCAAARRSATFPYTRKVGPEALRLYASGCSLDEIGRGLAQCGFAAPRGGDWYRASVRRLLARCPAAGVEKIQSVSTLPTARHRRSRGWLSPRSASSTPGHPSTLIATANEGERLHAALEEMIATGIMLTNEDQADELNARGWRRAKGGGPYTVEAVRRLKRDLGIASLKGRRARKAPAQAPLRERVRAERKVTGASAQASELNNKRGSGGPSEQFRRQMAERRAHAKRKFDGLARHGVKGSRALAEAANELGVETLSGDGVWTKWRVEYLYRNTSGRRPPPRPPKLSDDDIAEIVAMRREGRSLADIAFFMRLSDRIVSRLLQREAAKTTVE